MIVFLFEIMQIPKVENCKKCQISCIFGQICQKMARFEHPIFLKQKSDTAQVAFSNIQLPWGLPKLPTTTMTRNILVVLGLFQVYTRSRVVLLLSVPG
jgi:hypothetical protein